MPKMRLTTPVYLTLGWLAMVLGGIGVFLPVLPTTPFLLLAVWAFGKSSPKMAARLRAHKTLGPYIRDWEDHGVIPTSAKFLAIIMMTGTAIYLILDGGVPRWVAAIACMVMAAVGCYIVTRPGRPQSPRR